MQPERTLANLFITRTDGPDWPRFCADVGAAVTALRASAWQRATLFETDTYRFTVWLLAAWQSGCCVCLPGDDTPATLARLKARVDGNLGSLPGALPWPQSLPVADLHALDPDMPAVEVFTSGSTGEPVAIAKRLRQLDDEVRAQEATFGARVGAQTTLVSTVSHQHLYGLLFRVLWPLLGGRACFNRTIQYPEELLALPIDGPWALIASPAFLKRLPAELDWPRIAGRCRAIFSSGGPLPATAGEQAQQLTGAPVFEIYGSSETGGIGWRASADAPWTLLPGVSARAGEDGCLAVASPFLADDSWFQTADRIDLSAEGFRLHGRADRIVKIEEKRISLTRLEIALAACSGVSEARVLLLPGARTEVGAVVALNPQGQDQLAALGKFRMGQQLREILAGEFERVGLPRRWRFVQALPHNTMGKTTEKELQMLFAAPRFPAAQIVSQSENSVTLDLKLLPEIIYFSGHFPEFTILPGVTQLEWAMHYAREHLAVSPHFQGMDAIKFQQILRPGSQVQLTLEYKPGVLNFQFKTTEKLCSSGRIRLGAPE